MIRFPSTLFRSRARERASTLAALSLLALACSDNARTMVPRGVTGTARGESEPSEKPATPPEPAAPREPMAALPSPFAPGPGDLSPTSPPPAQAPLPDPAANAPERDLGSELADLVRSAGCIDLSAAAGRPGGKLSVSVSAYVLETGRITRATVSASGQPATALRCAEQRLMNTGLKGPIPTGAGTVSGVLTLEVIGAAPTTVQTAAPDPTRSPYAPPDAPAPPPDRASTSSDDSILRGAIPDEQAAANPDEQAGAP